MLNYFRIKIKLFKSRYLRIPTDSFCKNCGRDVHDFLVDDEIWDLIEPMIKYGKVLCYDCFCEFCKDAGLPPVWMLKTPGGTTDAI